MVTMAARKATELVCLASVNTEAHRGLRDSFAWGQADVPARPQTQGILSLRTRDLLTELHC